ncbi:DUF3800 domain-containing protein [Corynebacterium pseudodiphtheriticum]|uniref:DUF3800 domain-containing protein n=1 Tax=Corynebacterium pseudodiphtheriticum TaxID=37637 RepID=UPI0020C0A1FC|nr:DUF3800 domain-containing protein [Corynebacterium pseudodiphtheriticum]UQV54583.1 hypothetical protein L2D23_02430 [Corynebacterium pseudodiphtheriticum]
MLIAYLDEFGHQGPYISHSHPKFKTHPAFGYAGYVLPAENVRKFGGYFEHIKENLLQWEIQQLRLTRVDGKRKAPRCSPPAIITNTVEKFAQLSTAFTVALENSTAKFSFMDNKNQLDLYP